MRILEKFGLMLIIICSPIFGLAFYLEGTNSVLALFVMFVLFVGCILFLWGDYTAQPRQ